MTKPKGTLWYVGLESLESRYTLQLTEWNKRVLDQMKVKYKIVPGVEIDNSKAINVGQVLDAHGRPYYALSQIQFLVQGMREGKITKNDTIFFEDMFHPGFEALPYIFNQQGWRPKVFVRCLAQTVDPDDFVHAARMTEWMRKFEQMVNACVDAVLIASHEMASFCTAAGWTVPLIVTGLPFGKAEVRERANYKVPKSPAQQSAMWKYRPLKVAFAARTDQEKQPEFFLQLAQAWHRNYDVPVEFCILSGKTLTSNNHAMLTAINNEREFGTIKVYENLSKADYYHHLKYTRVLFNSALQDWVSNTVSEADALGANVLYPAYRSFPEVFGSDHTRLYVPWSLQDALVKLRRLLLKPHPYMGRISDDQDETIYRSVLAMNLWKKGQPISKQVAGRVIDPRDTSYRHIFSGGDWELGEVGNDFWEYGKVTDQQLRDSVRTK
jgi:hypothetical protein